MNPYREALVRGADGNFYGTTETGGSDNYGLVFKMAPDGTVTAIHDSSAPMASIRHLV